MKQQINLYRALYPAKPRWPFTKKATIIVSLSLLIVFGITGVAAWKIYELKQQYKFELSVKSIKETAFKNMKKEANDSIIHDKQAAELAALRTELKKKTLLKEQLEQEVSRAATGYLDHFVSLARQDIKGIWLNEIIFEKTDSSDIVSLAGKTTEPALVAKYLNNLSRETPFHGLSFIGMRVDEATAGDKQKGKNLSSFVVSTQELDRVDRRRPAGSSQ